LFLKFLAYHTDDAQVKTDIQLPNEILWMTQADMAQLFQCPTDNISSHFKNICEEGESDSSATTEDFPAEPCQL